MLQHPSTLYTYVYQHPTVLYAGMYSIMRKIAVLQTGKKPSNETDFEEKPSKKPSLNKPYIKPYLYGRLI